MERGNKLRVLVVLSEQVETEPDRLTREMRLRCQAAVDAWREAEACDRPYHEIVVSGGVFMPGQAFASACLMAQELENQGVPTELIGLEAESLDTYDNAKFTLQILGEMFPGRRFEITLATDWLHFRRARLAFLEYGGVKVVDVHLASAAYFPRIQQACLEVLGWAYAKLVDSRGDSWLPWLIRARRRHDA